MQPQLLKDGPLQHCPEPKLNGKEDAIQPCPRLPSPFYVVPKAYEGKNEPNAPPLRSAPPQGNIQISDDPLVERCVPRSPEAREGVVVIHAPSHVLGGLHTIRERPAAEEAPYREKFQVPVQYHLSSRRAGQRKRRGGIWGGEKSYMNWRVMKPPHATSQPGTTSPRTWSHVRLLLMLTYR